MKSSATCAVVLSLCLAGCTWLAPEYRQPSFDMPEKWPAATTAQKKEQIAAGEWWKNYRDPVLEKLITEAVGGNSELAIASARLLQAKAQYDYATANRLPMLGFAGLASRSQFDFDKNLLLSDKPSNIGFLGGLVAYEADLWGKQANAQEAAGAVYRGQSYGRDALRLSISAATAQLYFNILALDESLALMRKLVQTQQRLHQLTRDKFEAGAVPEITLRTSEAELAARTAELAKIASERDRAEGSLATLLGRSPRQILAARLESGKTLASLPASPVTPADLPSELLRRRPDVAAMEQLLIASNFNIGMARAAYFPTISLSGLLGVTDLDIANIYKGPVRTWDLGASLVGPLVDFGRTASGVELARASREEQLARYKASVRTAFKEVREALLSQEHAGTFAAEQEKRKMALGEALKLVNQRFSLGFASYPDVLPVERSLHEAELAAVAAKLDRLIVSVDLYKALGGGWRMQGSAN